MSSPGEIPHKRSGRPTISDYTAMHVLEVVQRTALERGEPISDRTLVREVVQAFKEAGAALPGASVEAIEARLRRRLRERRTGSTVDFCSNVFHASRPETVHPFAEEAGMHEMYDEPGVTAEACVDAVAASTERNRGQRASARVVERPGETCRRGRPRFLVSARVTISGSEAVELRLKPGAAWALAEALRSALAELEQRRAASPHDEGAEADVG